MAKLTNKFKYLTMVFFFKFYLILRNTNYLKVAIWEKRPGMCNKILYQADNALAQQTWPINY